MNRAMRRRLDKMEGKFCPDESKYAVLFTPLVGESESQYDERIKRWYAGEDVEGQKRIYAGPKQFVARIVFVDMDRKFAVRRATT